MNLSDVPEVEELSHHSDSTAIFMDIVVGFIFNTVTIIKKLQV